MSCGNPEDIIEQHRMTCRQRLAVAIAIGLNNPAPFDLLSIG